MLGAGSVEPVSIVKSVLSRNEESAALSCNRECYFAAGNQPKVIARLKDVSKNETKVAILSVQLPYDVARYQKADALLLAYGCKGMDEIPTDFDGETPTFGLNLPAAVYTVFGGRYAYRKAAGRHPKDR